MNVVDPATGLILRMTGALIFGTAAYGKLRSPAAFRATLRDYRLLPGFAIGLLGAALPALEIALALTLPVNALCPWPEYLAAALLMLFAGAMAINLVRGRADIACGCALGTGARHQLRWPFVVRNLAACVLILCARVGDNTQGPETLLALPAALAMFLLLEAANTLWALPRALKASGGAA